MDVKLIMNGNVTVDELKELHERKGTNFIIEDGQSRRNKSERKGNWEVGRNML